MCPVCEHPLNAQDICPICDNDFSEEEELADPSFYSQEDEEALQILRAFDF